MKNHNDDPNFTSSFTGLLDLVKYLRSDSGCPWDREQNSQSLTPMLLDETYELVSAIESSNNSEIMEELGDVLLHMAFQIEIAEAEQSFCEKDVFSTVISKYVNRHPHVFGDESLKSTEELKQKWEEFKRKEKTNERTSILDGIPSSQPSLSHSQTLQSRASHAGFDWDDLTGVRDKINEELDELEDSKTIAETTEEFGDLIFTLVSYGRKMNLDVEQALRLANAKFIDRFVRMEMLAKKRSQEFLDLSIEEKDELWNMVKASESKHDG